MVDFSELLDQPAGESVKPEALPQGDYPGIIKSKELGDKNKNKTPYVRYMVGLTGWPDGVEPVPGVDIQKRQQRMDFYLTPEARYRLDDFLKSCNIQAKGRKYAEVIDELIGQPVLVSIQQYVNEKTNEIGNNVAKLVGL